MSKLSEEFLKKEINEVQEEWCEKHDEFFKPWVTNCSGCEKESRKNCRPMSPSEIMKTKGLVKIWLNEYREQKRGKYETNTNKITKSPISN